VALAMPHLAKDSWISEYWTKSKLMRRQLSKLAGWLMIVCKHNKKYTYFVLMSKFYS
jgi:hypothetical protein